MLSLAVALLAGVLASLSPCVLPLLPMVLAAALAEHRLGPAALALGLALSFATVGVALGLVGFALGIEGEWLRHLAAALLLAVGVLLLAATLAARVSAAAEALLAPLARHAHGMAARGLGGQFALGAVLGLAWAPCTGPVLGGALALAANAATAPRAALTMLAFGLGSALPLLMLGYAARSTMPLLKRRLGAAGGTLRAAMGGAALAFGVAILTGADRVFEAWATERLPDGWLALVTRF